MAERRERRDNAPHVITERARIIGMLESGNTSREIARMTGLHVSTVNRWIRRWQEEGNVRTKPRSGRPRAVAHEHVIRILETIEENPMTDAVKLTRELQLPCHPRTTRRLLLKHGIKCCRPAVKEHLSVRNEEGRLGFALQYLAADEDYWNNVIFTDEKFFQSVAAGARHCWRLRNTRYDKKNIQEKARSGRVGVNFWAWMWANGPGELIRLDGRFRGEDYVRILEEVLLPSVRAVLPHPQPIILVHDRSPIHMCMEVREWLHDHPEVVPLDWPAKGCDMNPIKNLWAIMVRDWDIGNEISCQNIERHAREVWESVRRRPNICRSLVASMPRRIGAVIDALGGWSKY